MQTTMSDAPRLRSLAEIERNPGCHEQQQFYERCLQTPLGLIEKVRRPWGGVTVFELDEIDEQDLCAVFARDVAGIFRVGPPFAGISLTRNDLETLPRTPAVYWLNAPLDSEFQSWRIVYVGKAANLHGRWAKQTHHRHAQALEWNCRLDWWEVTRGTEALIEAALIYHLKPAWNERQ